MFEAAYTYEFYNRLGHEIYEKFYYDIYDGFNDGFNDSFYNGFTMNFATDFHQIAMELQSIKCLLQRESHRSIRINTKS